MFLFLSLHSITLLVHLINFIFLFFWYHPDPNIIHSFWVRILPSFHIFFSLCHSCFYVLSFSQQFHAFSNFFFFLAEWLTKQKGPNHLWIIVKVSPLEPNCTFESWQNTDIPVVGYLKNCKLSTGNESDFASFVF